MSGADGFSKEIDELLSELGGAARHASRSGRTTQFRQAFKQFRFPPYNNWVGLDRQIGAAREGHMKRTTLSIVLMLGLLGAILAPAASAAACSTPYTVLPGDNLFRIGLAFGVPWTSIAAANSLSNPSLIFPGQVLCIPSASGTPAPTATGPTPTPSATAAATAT